MLALTRCTPALTCAHTTHSHHTLTRHVPRQNKHFPELDEMMMDPEGDAKRHMKELDTNGDGSLDESEIESGQVVL